MIYQEILDFRTIDVKVHVAVLCIIHFLPIVVPVCNNILVNYSASPSPVAPYGLEDCCFPYVHY